MLTCERCEGTGWNLWMNIGKVTFLRCYVCAGARTIMWLMGAVGREPIAADIVLGRPQNKWIRP